MGAPKLFSPGPVMVKDNVRQALMHYDICHRGAEFEEMFVDVQEKIKKLFNADDSYYSLVVSGSGTSANETVLSSVFKGDDQVLLIRNGVFGERLQEIIDKYKIPKVEAVFEWAEYPDVNVVEKLLQENPKVTVVAMVFHETSTGMINPVGEVGALCKKYNKLLYVDCVSAAGGQHVDLVKNNIALATSVGGKCVGAFPGSAYICGREDVMKGLTAEQCKNVYLSLYKHYQSAVTTHQTPNTPNVTLFWALQTALTNIIEEGLANRVAGRERCAAILREGVKKLGLRMLLSEHMSSTVTSVFCPEGVDVKELLKGMEERGYVLYIGKGKYTEQGMFQIANMGEISEADCHEFLKVLGEYLAELKAKAK